jgi:hypothetical protein
MPVARPGHFDLLGLPFKPEEMKDSPGDDSPGACEKLGELLETFLVALAASGRKDGGRGQGQCPRVSSSARQHGRGLRRSFSIILKGEIMRAGSRVVLLSAFNGRAVLFLPIVDR